MNDRIALYNNGCYGFVIKFRRFNNLNEKPITKQIRSQKPVSFEVGEHSLVIRTKGINMFGISKTYMIKSELSKVLPKGWYKGILFDNSVYFDFAGESRESVSKYGF